MRNPLLSSAFKRMYTSGSWKTIGFCVSSGDIECSPISAGFPGGYVRSGDCPPNCRVVQASLNEIDTTFIEKTEYLRMS